MYKRLQFSIFTSSSEQIVKTYLRAIKARTEEALQTAIAEGLDLINLQDIQHWFTHCCYFSASTP